MSMKPFRAALELATEEELQQLTQLLFCRRFNPLDYWQTPDPIAVQSNDLDTWLNDIEQRFRFLAADGVTILKGKTDQFSYRQALMRVCQYLKIPFKPSMGTTDIEAEIFLALVSKAWKRLPASEQQALTVRVQRSLATAQSPEPLPLRWQQEPLQLALKGSSAWAVGSVLKPWLMKQITRQFAMHLASYQIAKGALVRGGVASAASFQQYLALQASRRGMAMTAASYGAVRTALAFVGPVLWGWFLADLGWRAIATNYGRIIPTIFTLAQIRLTRTECWEGV